VLELDPNSFRRCVVWNKVPLLSTEGWPKPSNHRACHALDPKNSLARHAAMTV